MDKDDCVPKEVISLHLERVSTEIENVNEALLREIVSVNMRIDNLAKSLDDLESEKTWLIRLVLGAVVLAVISLVITNGDFNQ